MSLAEEGVHGYFTFQSDAVTPHRDSTLAGNRRAARNNWQHDERHLERDSDSVNPSFLLVCTRRDHHKFIFLDSCRFITVTVDVVRERNRAQALHFLSTRRLQRRHTMVGLPARYVA